MLKALNKEIKPEWLDNEQKAILGAVVESWSAEGEDYGKSQPEASEMAPLRKVIAVDPSTGTPMTVVELGDGRFSRKVRR